MANRVKPLKEQEENAFLVLAPMGVAELVSAELGALRSSLKAGDTAILGPALLRLLPDNPDERQRVLIMHWRGRVLYADGTSGQWLAVTELDGVKEPQ